MKIITLISVFLFTLNCSINKVSNQHGFRFIDTKYEKIQLNKSNKNDIKTLIGPPSSKSDFGDIWFYIERKKTNQTLLKLGKKKIAKNNVIIIEFNEMGLVTDKKLLNLNNMNDLKFAEKKTSKKFSQDNFLYGVLSTFREKINAPTRMKQKKR
ncbi:outer membrane protein assembly factor BamE [Candidatus Pelagibacter sp.]|nr:outer membrane protein assembly factor BamE [Candidatus Pelagibacter sp.]